ncbi:MAG: OmpA family protein [Oscillospiraceae bacterium]|jgi:chemotaxis protein MotB|nr:OmpA family protein [Oscillospiraceae bacterium]
MAKHKGPPHEEHADESWLIPYADLLTLLLALFIVLFAASSINSEKYQAIMSSFQDALGGGGGMLPGSDGVLPPGMQPPGTGLRPTPTPPAGEDDEGEGDGDGNIKLWPLFDSLQDYVDENHMDDNIDVAFTGQDVLITLKSDIWFGSGSAEITPSMREQAHMLAQLLRDNQNPEFPLEVIVAGHTDNVPIHSSQYPSNWHLSARRALNFLMALLEDSDLDPTRFSSRGYGEYAPIATNSTPEGRQRNRRVELLVSQPLLHEDDPKADRTAPPASDAGGEPGDAAGVESDGEAGGAADGNSSGATADSPPPETAAPASSPPPETTP